LGYNTKIEIFNFERLIVYQKSIEFSGIVYKAVSQFPKQELFGLSLQFIRASNSVALNIAEGAGNSKKNFIRFLKISLGSARECLVCSTIAFNQNYIDFNKNNEIRQKLTEICKMLNGLIKSIKVKD
jgi:four helix bundle protein